MKPFWMFAVVGSFALSLSGAALADCAGHQQTVKADAPMTVASESTSSGGQSDRK